VRLLRRRVAAINAGRAAVIDLAGVTASDSAGLALLIECLSVAKAANRACGSRISRHNYSSLRA